MTNEEKAEEYADKMLNDSKYPFIFNKEKVKAYIIKVYLDSLNCCKDAYNKGLAEGRKETKTEWQNCFLSCSSPYCRKYFENVAIEGCLGNMSKREQELYVRTKENRHTVKLS